ncbi:MAG: SURF1 family protein [Gammaproteobacteria bacterium]|nr:SURF1 family protein [Gammaproteobacteria bacterium]
MRLGQLTFRPGPVPTLAMLIAVPLFCSLGLWQLDRAETKRVLRARLDARWDAPVATPLPARPDWEALEFARVEARGEFVAAHQFVVGDRLHAGRRGVHVITPLRLDGGAELLVNRGWVADAGRATPPPDGGVVLTGRLVHPQPPALELGPAAPAEAPWRAPWSRLDPAAYADVAGVVPLPAALLLDPDAPHGFVRDWRRPTGGLAPSLHVGYAVQWFAFAAIALVLWVRHAFGRRTGAPA